MIMPMYSEHSNGHVVIHLGSAESPDVPPLLEVDGANNRLQDA